MDRQLSDREIRNQRLKSILIVSTVGLILILLFAGFRNLITPTLKQSRILLATAEIGRIDDAVTASGTVVPEFEQMITSPIQSRIEAVFSQAGETVERGASILLLNKEFVTLQRERLIEELELLKNRKTQLNLALERNRTELQAQFDIKKLNLELLASKMGQAEHLHSIGAGSKDQLDQARLNLEIARRELSLLEQTMDNEEKTLTANLREVDLNIGIQDKSIAEIDRQLELAEIRAERSGVITWVNNDIGASIEPGSVVARIADLSSYKVVGRISDIHTARLRLGQPVRVRVNERDLEGVISGIEPTINNGIITFFVDLEEETDPELRSNLRVDVFVITAFKDEVVRVKYGPFINGPGQQEIFVVENGLAIRKTVTIGSTNLDFVEISQGVKPGAQIIISDMEKYLHRESIRIKAD